MHPAALPAERLLKECDETRTRRGGPGGQHRNKVETAVILVHRPTGVAAEASERRSQAENRRVALARLRLRLAVDHRAPVGPSGPSPLWRSRTRNERLAINPEHSDYPALVAEALDRLQATAWDVQPAAHVLGVSPTQLVKLLHKAPAARALLEKQRAGRGLAPLL
jgi:hypothetical protein